MVRIEQRSLLIGWGTEDYLGIFRRKGQSKNSGIIRVGQVDYLGMVRIVERWGGNNTDCTGSTIWYFYGWNRVTMGRDNTT